MVEYTYLDIEEAEFPGDVIQCKLYNIRLIRCSLGAIPFIPFGCLCVSFKPVSTCTPCTASLQDTCKSRFSSGRIFLVYNITVGLENARPVCVCVRVCVRANLVYCVHVVYNVRIRLVKVMAN